ERQRAQANLLRSRKEISDMVALLENRRLSTDATTRPANEVYPEENRPLGARLADSIVANYLLFQKESPGDVEINESLAQAYLTKAVVYWGTNESNTERLDLLRTEALAASNSGCDILRELIKSNASRENSYADLLASALLQRAQNLTDDR